MMDSGALGRLRGQAVTLVEVAPRDGLQNEAVQLSTADKVAFVDLLSAAHLPAIEVTAFVSAAWVPQMADAADVVRQITRRPGTRYTALVPNLKGFERALAAGVTEVAVVLAASETFSRRNINQSIDASLAVYREVCDRARAADVRVRGYLSTAFGCPYEGPVAVDAVVARTMQLLDCGVFEVAISDTIGVAHPGQVARLLESLQASVAIERIALHLHDTRGTALANVMAGLLAGVRTFDAAAGGLGGCPYAPGAAGNLATDDLVFMLDGLGMDSGVVPARLHEASAFIATRLDHPLPSRYARAPRLIG